MRSAWAWRTACSAAWWCADRVRADLHLHSTASDGSLSPGAVAVTARAAGLDLIALCDHDTVAGVAAATAAAGPDLRVIPALEVSSTLEGRELHLLGYGVDPADPAIVRYGETAAAARAERMRGMIEQLARRNVHVSWDDVLNSADVPPQCLGRPHLARALQVRGYVRTVADAFDRFIGNDGPAYVHLELFEPADALSLIHAAGGLAVWAHPRLEVFDRRVRELRALGLDGVECYRPRLTPTEVQYFEAAARDLGLVRTGGSDWHGSWHGPMGDFAVAEREIGDFLDALQRQPR